MIIHNKNSDKYLYQYSPIMLFCKSSFENINESAYSILSDHKTNYYFYIMPAEDITQLLKYINAVHPLTSDEQEAFTANWHMQTVKRKVILTAAGETERYLYFVLDGVQRAFYFGDDGRESTIVFTYPPSFSGVADSFLTQTPSLYFFETITASRFLQISHQQIELLMKNYTGIQQLIFKATSFALKGALQRQIELQSFSNEQKFKVLLKRSPHILQLIPHKYLASYLGMDAGNFSKLLNNTRL